MDAVFREENKEGMIRRKKFEKGGDGFAPCEIASRNRLQFSLNSSDAGHELRTGAVHSRGKIVINPSGT